jgi:hypothetical protein
VRYAIVIVAAALLFPAWAGAASPQIYVGSNSAYTVVFKVDGGAVSVLGLDAPLYCGEGEHFGSGTISVFKRSTRMREGPDGLEALLGGGGGSSSKIEATFDGTRLTGTFTFDFSEGSFHCQTSGFYPARPAVSFEAERYEPVGSGSTLPATKGEVPIYYGSDARAEVLLEPNPGSVVFRGAAPSNCPVAGKPATGKSPLFGDVIDTDHEGDSFHRTLRRDGKSSGETWSESRSVAGTVTDEGITGSYVRSTIIRPATGAPQRCKTGPLPFQAVRYLPSAVPFGAQDAIKNSWAG